MHLATSGYSFGYRECLNEWAHEIHEVGRIGWEALFVELSAVEAEDKEAQSTFERIGATRETTRLASQARQIMTELCIVCLHRIGIRFALGDFISTKVIPEPLVGIETIRVIPLGFWRLIDNLLQGCLSANPDDTPAQNAASLAIY